MTPWEGCAKPPREWQARCLPLALEAVRGGKRGVGVACTGAGKSLFTAELMRLLLHELGPTIVVGVPTRRLVTQTAAAIATRVDGRKVGRFFTDAKEVRPITVTCYASLPALAEAMGPGELEFTRSPVRLLLCDEAHRTEGPEILAAVERLHPERVIGLTATPFRSDEAESLRLFDEELFRYTPGQAVRDGVLVPWRIVPWSGGDAPLDDACVRLIREHAQGPTACNARSISDAEAFAERLNREGIPAAAVHSRLSDTAQQERLDQLERGELRVVTYPSLLSEGVDFPWLNTLCFRRPVGARVRIVQELGRVLRAHPGKSEAIVLDPHDLFGAMSTSFAAALGFPEVEPIPADPADTEDDRDEKETEEKERRARSVGVAEAFARALYLAADADGLLADSGRVQSRAWRARPASEKQRMALLRLRWTWRYLPMEISRAILELAPFGSEFTAGLVSDLLSVEVALARKREQWSPVVRAPSAAELRADFEAKRTAPVRVAAVLWQGFAAMVVERAGRILEEACRPAEPGETWGSVNRKAVMRARKHGEVAEVAADDLKSACFQLIRRRKAA